MHITVIGGRFDREGGKPSRVIVPRLAEALHADVLLNGGSLDTLTGFDPTSTQALLWMPDIANDEVKILPTLKQRNPRLLLVSSKRTDNRDFGPGDMVGRLLKSRSNLGIMIEDAGGGVWAFRILDPLGNQYALTTSVEEMAGALRERLAFLAGMRRVRSRSVGEALVAEVPPRLVEIIRRGGDIATGYVNAVNPNRLLGNASTRCAKGFPAFRTGEGLLTVTRRNVDKASLQAEDFVVVRDTLGEVEYFGDKPPSVDTPIQVRLFGRYPRINHILHYHMYLRDGVFTRRRLPCGAIEEADEIGEIFSDPQASRMLVNLLGHGCLIMTESLDDLDRLVVPASFRGRPFPEA